MRNKKSLFSWSFKNRNKILPYLLLLPCFVLIAVILLFPIIQAARLSLYRISTFEYLSKKPTFVMFDNYKELLLSPSFWHSVKVTLIFAGGSTIAMYILGLATALLLNLKFKGRGIARGLLIVPWAIPPVTLAFLWTWIYDPQFGVMNYFLRSTGLTTQNIGPLIQPSLSLYAIMAARIWRGFPFPLLALLAGLQAIPNEYYEAASIDGANFFQKFWHITLPQLKYVSKVIIILMAIWDIGHFTVIWLTTAGGPVHSSETVVIKTYLSMFSYYQLGKSSAMVMVLFLMSFSLAIIYFWVMGMTKSVQE